jgi:hypothetical protein
MGREPDVTTAAQTAPPGADAGQFAIYLAAVAAVLTAPHRYHPRTHRRHPGPDRLTRQRFAATGASLQ